MFCYIYLTFVQFVFSFNLLNINQQENAQDQSEWRIVGGNSCQVEQYPFVVSIRTKSNKKHFCGGSLIAPRFVLSAAHCLEQIPYSPRLIKVQVGSTRLHSSKSQEMDVKRIIIHDEYNKKTADNDIALLQLADNVNFDIGTVAFVKLPTDTLPDDLSEICDPNSFMVAGWGDTKVHAIGENASAFSASSKLQCVNIPYITNEKCSKHTGFALNDNVMCTMSPVSGKDACQGDSGGPLFCNGTQYGVISWGRGCGLENSPGFYTRVDRYLDFIENTFASSKRSGILKPEQDNLVLILLVCYSIISWLN